MTKYGPYPRRELRALFKRWVRENRARLAVATVGAVALMAFESWMFTISGGSEALRWYLMGAVHVAVLAAYVGAIGTTFLVDERSAIFHLRGAWGEDFTTDELSRARRKKLIWGWVDSVTLKDGDIDHLVVTRFGGLIAIDSKWRSSADHLDPAAIAQDARRARLRGEGVVHSLLKAQRGSRRASGKSFRVSPLVVLWGAARDAIPEGASLAGVDIVQGPKLIDWLKRLDGDVIDEAAAFNLLAQIEGFRSSAWATGTGR